MSSPESSAVRVRFAPSPTGYLHIGGARTALFNWLYARHRGGTFILRIEDTDDARNSEQAIAVILEGLKWLGLDWDEGPTAANPAGPSRGERGPYFQSQRHAIYRRHAEALRERGAVYEKEGALWFRMEREAITLHDLVCGEVTRTLTDREAADPDFVIVRSDGKPVFHFVNVVDDLEMGITHVLRGEDHLSNTFKHVALFRALGAPPPQYGHIPLILNQDGSKMSKRDTGASLETYLKDGFVPEAVVNYLCLLGWSPKDDSQVMPVTEIIRRFDVPQILRANARFDFAKMQWMNYEHLRCLPLAQLRELATPHFRAAGIELGAFDTAYVEAALHTAQEKVRQITGLPAFCRFYFTDDVAPDTEAAAALTSARRPAVKALRDALEKLEPFSDAAIEASLKAAAAEAGIKPRDLVQPVRVACTGALVGPSLYHLMAILGRERTLRRLDGAIKRMVS